MLPPRERSAEHALGNQERPTAISRQRQVIAQQQTKPASTMLLRLQRKYNVLTRSKLKTFEFLLISLVLLLPFGLTQFAGEPYIVEPTPALGLVEEDLTTTVLLVNNDHNNNDNNNNVQQTADYHARYLNVRPEVGLLTSTARTFIQEGVTTEYATQVVGTTLDNGRYYAQYLKKSSRVLYEQEHQPTATPVLNAAHSVVTSWVGESLLQAGSALPQSHNDLYNAAEQPDWRDIDDRLLDEQRARAFIGNTDFVSLNGKYGSILSPSISDASLKPAISSSSSSFSSSLSSSAQVVQQDTRPFAANKVLHMNDLPTYTVKNYFAPSGYSWQTAADDDEGSSQQRINSLSSFSSAASGSTTQDRTPKLYYKQLLSGQAGYTSGAPTNQFKAASADSQSSPVVLNLPSRVLATTTYYGFADFTTVVGDSVIVFTPSSSAAQQPPHLLGHVTSIRGEATLGGSNNAQVSNLAISVTQDLIVPTRIGEQQQQMQTMSAAIPLEDLQQLASSIAAPTQSEQSQQHEEQHSLASAVDIPVDERMPQLETSEFSVVPPPSIDQSIGSAQSAATSDAAQTTPMLSRPSEEDILRIYASLAAAAAATNDTAAAPVATSSSNNSAMLLATTIIQQVDVTTTTTPMDPAVAPTATTSNVHILGGAATIFFEDDPFANFVEPTATTTPTKTDTVDTTTTIGAITTSENAATSTESTDADEVVDTTTAAVTAAIEENTTQQQEEIEQAVKQLLDQAYNTVQTTTSLTYVEEEHTSAPDSTTTNAATSLTTTVSTEGTTAEDTKAAVIVKEISADEQQNANSNCISRTSQVFLTQVPKTLTHFTTYLLSTVQNGFPGEPTTVTSTSIETNIVPSFDISQATKHYCIQATGVIEAEAGQTMAAQVEKPVVVPHKIGEQLQNENTNVDSAMSFDDAATTAETPTSTELEPKAEIDDDEQELGDEDETLEQAEGEEEEEIELIYKTLYTTYTYLTTFFHDDTTSISSHTELVTNVITSTVGVTASETVDEDAPQTDSYIRATATDPTAATAATLSKFMVPSELESIIRAGEQQQEDDDDIAAAKLNEKSLAEELMATPSLDINAENLLRKTYYTTYTYYTTIFADGETEIMSRTEVFTNYASGTLTPTLKSLKALSSTVDDVEQMAVLQPSNSYSTMIRHAQQSQEPPPDLQQYSSVTLVTDVRSSSSNGARQIINKPIPPAAPQGSNDVTGFSPSSSSLSFDDQISSESNTDEILPSATLLLQTSFTTFTYYTTMYGGDATNVASRLETVTNVVTETLQPTKTFNLEEATLPITYFTTFTYWTKLAKDGEVSTLSREETISNVVTPSSNAAYDTSSSSSDANDALAIIATTSNTLAAVASNTMVLVEAIAAPVPSSGADDAVDSTIQAAPIFDVTNSISSVSAAANLAAIIVTNTLEPTTYFTTYTYYTTSYEADSTITDSRFETISNVITPTVTLTTYENNNGGSMLNSVITTTPIMSSPTILYDYKKIIDADGISTLFFTTEIVATTDANGVAGESLRSTSSLYVDEEKKAQLPASSLTVTTSISLNAEGSAITVSSTAQKQYKTGLVRLIEGTRIGNRTTTLYQSKVIGTVIDNRYAQIIESTSSFLLDQTELPTTTAAVNEIAATNTQEEQLKVTQQSTLNAVAPTLVQSSINEDESNTETSLPTDQEEEDSDDDDESDKGNGARFTSAGGKKRTFTPVIRPFASRNRPQFAPKKKNGAPSSATIITRSDFTPTITATPALKSTAGNRLSSSRRGAISSSPIPGGSGSAATGGSSRRFGRPSKSSGLAGGNTPAAAVSSAGGFAAARNRLSSSRLTPNSSSRRPAAGFPRPSASGGFRAGFSSVYAGSNSRVRIKPTASLGLAAQSSTTEAGVTLAPDNNSAEEESSTQEQAGDTQEEEENATESSRRNQNPLLRLRRPLNRPSGFTPAGARPRTANSPSASPSPVSTRRNPLSARAKSSTTTTTTTTTTARPRPRSFQRPTAASFQNRARPQSNLFPPRGLFQAQRPLQAGGQQDAGAENKKQEDGAGSDAVNEADDDSEYEDDDEEGEEEDAEEEVNRRRRSNAKQKGSSAAARSLHVTRVKRAAVDASSSARANFRNRFRRPKPVTSASAEERSNANGAEAVAEHETPPPSTARSRVGSRFNSRYHHTTVPSTTAAVATEGRSNSNYRAIRPTRPTSGRAQFTLREKDTTTQKASPRPGSGTSSFRRPKTVASTGRRPGVSSSGSNSSANRRLKSYAASNNAASSNDNGARNSAVRSRSGSSSPAARGRSTSSNSRGRSRNEEQYNQPAFDGTITVTHVVPAEVTIPVVNGKVTEYRNVVTGKTSTEVLSPQQYSSFVGTNGQSTLALTRQDSSVNYAGATEITQYVLHESATTTVTFTPTTIRGRKTSFSHIIPSTVYSVEQVVSTAQPQISANAPLANILLSQLLLGNIGLPGAQPQLGGVAAGALGAAGGVAFQPVPSMPVTEYRTHASTYVTTLFEGTSTVLPITFQGKKILTTVFDTTAQTITATEFITDTIVTTPSVQLQQQQPAAAAQVNSLLLQQLLLQQQLQPQAQLGLGEAILPSMAPQLLYSDQLQELDTNNIRSSQSEKDELVDAPTSHKASGSRKKSGRKSNKAHKRKQHQQEAAQQSSIITLYVSGRRPGEFSTILSTVYNDASAGGYEASTLHKRQASVEASALPSLHDAFDIFGGDDYSSDGSELVPSSIVAEQYWPAALAEQLDAQQIYQPHAPPPAAVQAASAIEATISNLLLDSDASSAPEQQQSGRLVESTQTLESIVGDVGLWYAKSTQKYGQQLEKQLRTEHASAPSAEEAKSSRQYFLV